MQSQSAVKDFLPRVFARKHRRDESNSTRDEHTHTQGSAVPALSVSKNRYLTLRVDNSLRSEFTEIT